jgi:hypothetical protein
MLISIASTTCYYSENNLEENLIVREIISNKAEVLIHVIQG